MSRDGLISLIARGGVVASRPLLILLIAKYSEALASDVARLFLWSVFLTSAVSMSVYKSYMEVAIHDGIMAVLPRILVHSLYYILCLAVMSVVTDWWIIAIPLFVDFLFHQISRVFAYQKRFISWAFYNFLSLVLVSSLFLLLRYFDAKLYTLMALLIIASSITLFLLYSKNVFSLLIDWSEAFFGTSRKFYFSADKLVLSFFLLDEEFWMWAIIFQLSNVGVTVFDATIIAPKKKEIVLNNVSYRDMDVISPGFLLATVAGVMCMSFYIYNIQDYFIAGILLLCFSLRSVSSCLLNFFLEFYFWRESVARISIVMFVASLALVVFAYLLADVSGLADFKVFALVFLQGISMAMLCGYTVHLLRGE